MPSIREEMAADIASAIALYGQTFEWEGETYPCVSRDYPTGLELKDDGGFIEGVNTVIVVAKSAFEGYDPANTATFPFIGDLVNNSRHQVIQINGHKDPTSAQLILYIGSVDG